MSEDLLQILQGLKVKKFKFIEDYLQLYLENGVIINVYGRWKAVDVRGQIATDGDRLAELAGKRISQAVDSTDEFLLKFDDGQEFIAGLREEDYEGPEALQIFVPGSPPKIHVWN